LIPTARVIAIQASVPLMMGLLVWMTREAMKTTPSVRQGEIEA
jgi:hypothetical protein